MSPGDGGGGGNDTSTGIFMVWGVSSLLSSRGALFKKGLGFFRIVFARGGEESRSCRYAMVPTQFIFMLE